MVGDRDGWGESWGKGREEVGGTRSFHQPQARHPQPMPLPIRPSHRRAQEGAGRFRGPRCARRCGPRGGAEWSAGPRCPTALLRDLRGPRRPQTQTSLSPGHGVHSPSPCPMSLVPLRDRAQENCERKGLLCWLPGKDRVGPCWCLTRQSVMGPGASFGLDSREPPTPHFRSPLRVPVSRA